MSSKVMDQIKEIIDAKAQMRPTPMEFELAYQARVAMDKVRFAIRHREQWVPGPLGTVEVSLQFADTLDGLEAADRHFQKRFR